MFDTLRALTDRLLGRGSSAIAVPVMDGALKPNRVLDQADVVATIQDIDDLASDGRTLRVSAGPVLYRLENGALAEDRRFDADITAVALSRSGRLAVALGGKRVLVLDADGGRVAQLEQVTGQPLHCVNALAFESDDRLVFSEGSQRRGPDQWCHDLMELGASGRVARWEIAGGQTVPLVQGLGHAFGVLPTAGGVLVSESWRHRVLRIGEGAARPVLAELPGYASRMAAARDGGFWLTCFVCRTQLVEFVLREPAYRKRMIAEIDPRYWIAPALSSGHSFLEPLQGAGVKQMGVLKPWAPPRSYGLVLRVADDGRILRSMHSQVDGRHHGITAVAEHDGALYAASKGSGRLLRVGLGETR
jgi:hypothetical protein